MTLGRSRLFGLALGLFLALHYAKNVLARPKWSVVLDPGHGGHQSGTRSEDGVPEKKIALAVAKHLRTMLVAKGVRVVMTREADLAVSLDERVRVADRAEADVYVSIHANYAPVGERRGAETYILSALARDEVARSVTVRENEEDGASPPQGGDVRPRGEGKLPTKDIDLILDDLRRGVAHEGSARLARRIQDRLELVLGLRPGRGLRQAPFKVLKGVQAPAVLVELGYLSNRAQAAFLSSPAGQRASARALFFGIWRFLKDQAPYAAGSK